MPSDLDRLLSKSGAPDLCRDINPRATPHQLDSAAITSHSQYQHTCVALPNHTHIYCVEVQFCVSSPMSFLATSTKIFNYDDNRIFVHCVSVQL